MKSTPLFVALLFTLLLLAVGTLATPKESDYPIKVQVTSSQYAAYPDSQSQVLVVITDGKRYSLAGPTGDGLLALGGYKAKLVSDVHKNTYEFTREYEFQFPDGK